MKAGYVLLDGCGDRPSRSLNFTTPLEAAHTPVMDRIARRSKMGRVITVGRGISPESDIAVFNMLGYSFSKGYAGRGVVEAIGAGVEMKTGYLAMRANFATAANGLIADRRAGRDLTEEESRELEEELRKVSLRDAEFVFKGTFSYRGVLVINADIPLSAEVSNTDPAYIRVKGFGAAVEVKKVEKIQKCVPLERTAGARRAAELVNEFLAQATKVLEEARVNKERRRAGKKPANLLLLRDAGDHLPEVEPFSARHGIRGVALVDMPAEVGIAKLLKMKMVPIRDHRDLAEKARQFNAEMGEGTLVYAHIKGPDEFGHDGDAPGKRKNVEQIDSQFFARIQESIGDARFAVSCDHSTPCELKMHSSDPVPLMMTAESGDEGCSRFTESDARRGSLGTLAGKDVLRRVLA